MAIKVETKVKYAGEISFKVGHTIFLGSLFHKRDHYDNGSWIDLYAIEINREHFESLKNRVDDDE